MISALLVLLVTQLPVVLFGSAIAFLPSLRKISLHSRIAQGWLAGATLMTMIASLLSLVGAWGERSIAIPLLIAAVAAPIAARRRAHAARLLPEPLPARWSLVPLSLLATALLLLGWQIFSGGALRSGVVAYDIAKAQRWSEHGVEPSLFALSDPTGAPLQPVIAMWTDMLQPDGAIGAALWMPLLLLVVFISAATAPVARLLGARATPLASGVIVLAMALALIASDAAATSTAWLLVLAPLAMIVGSSPGTPIMYVVTIAATATLAHRAGVFVALALVLLELTRSQTRRATLIAVASGAAILPWWVVLAVDGYAPWSGILPPTATVWNTYDPALVVLSLTALLLLASRWRRRLYLAPSVLFAILMVGIAVTHAPDAATAALIALRLCTPVLITGACLVALRPLHGESENVPVWKR